MRLAASILPLLLGMQATAIADVAEKPGVSVRRGPEDRSWQLQAKQALMADILQELQRVAGINIHYSVLPEGPVSATCVADKVPTLLTCLLGPAASSVFGNADAVQPKDVWILGSSVADSAADCSPKVQADSQEATVDALELERLYSEADSKDPKRRGNALYALAAAEDESIDDTLRAAFDDGSALVRSQVLAAWVRRHGVETAGFELQRAVQDPDANVRMQAVELSNDAGLLAQALRDSDAMVRMLAKSKLDELVNQP